MKSHENGKKHLRLAAQHRKQLELAEKTLFVRGFPKGTLPQNLQQYFSNFGPVHTVSCDRRNVRGVIVLMQEKNNCHNHDE